MNMIKAIAAALLAASTCAAAQPQEGEPALRLRGFGTLGAVHSNARNADFVSGIFASNGAGTTRRWAAGVDSRLGLQADARLSEQFSAVLQLVAQQGYDSSYTPRVEWANIKYQATPDLELRVGRSPSMPFMVSDARLVGYANPWIRPPQEVYGLTPVTSKDGVSGAYRMYFGDRISTLQATYGNVDMRLPRGGHIRAKRYLALENTVEARAFTARVGYSAGRLDYSTPELESFLAGLEQFRLATAAAPALRAASGQAAALSARYRFNDARISLFTLGASYDRGPWLFMGEWARSNGHSFRLDATAWYALGGYRIGAFTPYAIAARLKSDAVSEPGISTAGLPAPLATAAGTLNATLASGLARGGPSQRSIALGLRWDLARNTALKLQYDRIDLDAGSAGRLGNIQPAFQPGGKVDVFGVALDFVF